MIPAVYILRMCRTGPLKAWRFVGVEPPAITAPCLLLVMTGIPAVMNARAEVPSSSVSSGIASHYQAESTYLSLTRDRVRQQLAVSDFEAAARTLQWIRKVDPDDMVAGILAIELQLRHGIVAAAAMRLIEVLDGARLADDARAEEQRIEDCRHRFHADVGCAA